MMDYEEFKQKLKDKNVEIDVWAESFDLSYSGVTKWKYNGVPKWVEAHFKLEDEIKTLNELKQIIIDTARKLEN